MIYSTHILIKNNYKMPGKGKAGRGKTGGKTQSR